MATLTPFEVFQAVLGDPADFVTAPPKPQESFVDYHKRVGRSAEGKVLFPIVNLSRDQYISYLTGLGNLITMTKAQLLAGEKFGVQADTLEDLVDPATGSVLVDLPAGNVLRSGWCDEADPGKQLAGDYISVEDAAGRQLCYFEATDLCDPVQARERLQQMVCAIALVPHAQNPL